MIEFTVPYPPPANHRLMVVRNRMIKTQEARDYAIQVGLLANITCKTPLTKEVRVSLYVYRPRKVGDLDNIFKILLDAMSGIIYCDDKQIIELHAFRREDKINPRIRVFVEEVVEYDKVK